MSSNLLAFRHGCQSRCAALSLPDCCQTESLACSQGSSNDDTEDLLTGVEVFRAWLHAGIPKVTPVQVVTKRSASLCPVRPRLPVSPVPLGSHLAMVQRQLLAQRADLAAQLLDPHKESVRSARPGTGERDRIVPFNINHNYQWFG